MADVAAALRGTQTLRELEPRFAELRTLIADEASDPVVVAGEIKRFVDAVGDIEGTPKLKSALNAARKDIRKRSGPNREGALKDLDKARGLYDEQLEWRAATEGAFTDTVLAYEDTLRDTIGVRSQERLTREQGLYLASCSANHRDISLAF